MAEGVVPAILIVLAHNEERRIGACLASLPDMPVHVVVNGSRDRTAEIARHFPVVVHDWPEGGKARSWNRIVLDAPGLEAEAFVFIDGDAEVLPGSIEALVRALRDNPCANAAAGLPANGRGMERYRAETIAGHGLFGDLYALSGAFVTRLRDSNIRLPQDLVGDDSLVGALAKTNLADESDWQDTRIVPCLDAGFLCKPITLTPASVALQYRRMVNYSVRHFQNRIVSAIMRSTGPAGLPRHIADLLPEWLPRFAPRRDLRWWWFDRQALIKMRRSVSRASPG